MDWKSSLESLRDSLPQGEDAPVENPAELKPAKKERLDIILDKKGRKGKAATIVAGFTCDDSELGEIATALKQKLGVGGSHRCGEILIQGDKRQQTLQALTAMGYQARII